MNRIRHPALSSPSRILSRVQAPSSTTPHYTTLHASSSPRQPIQPFKLHLELSPYQPKTPCHSHTTTFTSPAPPLSRPHDAPPETPNNPHPPRRRPSQPHARYLNPRPSPHALGNPSSSHNSHSLPFHAEGHAYLLFPATEDAADLPFGFWGAY